MFGRQPQPVEVSLLLSLSLVSWEICRVREKTVVSPATFLSIDKSLIRTQREREDSVALLTQSGRTALALTDSPNYSQTSFNCTPGKMDIANCSKQLIIDQKQTRISFEGVLTIVPYLKAGDIVVLDNASFHTSPMTKQLIERAGATLLFLSPYRLI